MRVTHVIPGLTYERGGTSTVLEALTRHQVAAGLDVTVLRTDQGARRGERPVPLATGVQERVAKVIGPDRVAYAPGFARLVRDQLPRTDILHVHSVFTYPVHATLRAAAKSRVPVVLSPHGILHRRRLVMSPRQKRVYLSIWGGLVRRACTVWHYTSDEEAAESWPYDNSPRFVLGLGIDPEPFEIDRAAARQAVATRWPRISDRPYVLFLGRIHPLKRPDLMLESFLASAPADCHLVFAGPDEVGLWADLAGRYLRDPAAADRVAFLGPVVGADKYALLAGARLFALPSEHENFGVTIIEALAAGTPVLASDRADAGRAAEGYAETVPLEPAVWRAALRATLTRPAVTAEWSESTRRWVRDRFGWGPLVARLTDQYTRILSAGRSG